MMNQDDELYNSIMGIQPSPEEEEQSLIRKLAAQGMTGLQYVGETLDKPGQALRGLLAGKPAELLNLIPFSDALGITSSEGLLGGTPFQWSDDEDAVSGRDLLEKAGWLGANEEGLDWGDVAGFGADILTDPTTWIPGVGMTKIGKALGKAGLAPDLATQARRLQLPVHGAAGARHQLTAKQLLDQAIEAGDKTAMDKFRLALGKGKELAPVPTPEELAKPIGGMINVGLPFVDSLQATVPMPAIADALDKFVGNLRYGNVVGRGLNTLFDAGHSYGGAGESRYLQETVIPNAKLQEQMLQNRFNRPISELKGIGATKADEISKEYPEETLMQAMYNAGEGVGPDVAGIRGVTKNLGRDLMDVSQQAALRVNPLEDPMGWVPRRKIQEEMGGAAGAAAAADLTKGRQDVFRGLSTTEIEKHHQKVAQLLEEGAIPEGTKTEQAQYVADLMFEQQPLSQPTYRSEKAYLAQRRLNRSRLPQVEGLDRPITEIPREEFLHGRPTEPEGFFQELSAGVAEKAHPGIRREQVDLSKISNQFDPETPAYAIVARGKDGRPMAMSVIANTAGHKQVIGLARDAEKGTRSSLASLRVMQNMLDDGLNFPIESLSDDMAGLLHHAHVEDAIQRKLPVPEEVVADYPKYPKEVTEQYPYYVTNKALNKFLKRVSPAQEAKLQDIVASGSDLDRHYALARHALEQTPKTMEAGLFMDPVGAYQIVANSTAEKAARSGAFQDALKDANLSAAYPGSPMIPASEGAKILGLDPQAFQYAPPVPAQFIEELKTKAPKGKDTGALGKLADIVRNITGVNKAWMTGAITNPSFPSRNVGSGQVANSYFGLANPLEAMHGIADFFTGGKLLKTAGTRLARGEDIPGLAANPAFQAQAKIAGRAFDPTDDNGATNFVRELLASYSGDYGGKHTADTLLDNQTGVGDFVGGMLGPEGPEAYSNRKVLGEAAKTWDQLRGREGGWKELLVGAPGVGGRKEATSAPLKAGATLNNYAESLNRVNPWLSQFLKGTDPAEAMRQVNRAQINYSPKNFTDIENRYLTQLIPFYKFLKSSGVAHLDELVHNPGGPLSQLLQGTSQIHDTEEVLPEYVKENLAIPVDKIPGLKQLLGSNDPESKRYLTGLGMMYEPLTQLIAGGDRGDLPFLNRSTAFESLGTLNPLIKALGETATGRSFFRQDETGGGQLMDELDPVIGRLLSNIKDRATGTKTEDPRMPVPGAGLFEVAAANSPFSRLLSTARGITDTREGGWKKGLSNFLIGPKLTDVNDKAVLGVLRGLANQDINSIPEAEQMVEFYVPKHKRGSLSPDEVERLNQDMLIKKIVQKKLKRKDSVVDPLEQLQTTLLGL